jgi:hypothetical protein
MKVNGKSASPSGHALRECNRCKRIKVPEGGVETSPGKWKCVDCWRGVSPAKTKGGFK